MATMTQKEMYTHIMLNMADDVEVVEFCNKKIAQIENRKSFPRKANPDVVEYRAAVATLLADNPTHAYTSNEVAEAIGGSPRKASVNLNKMVEENVVVRIEPETKGGRITYCIAQED